MKRLALALLVPATLVAAANALAAPGSAMRPSPLSKLLYHAYGSITVPPEWAGVWTIDDTTYDCDRRFLRSEIHTDTLCTGQLLHDTPEEIGFEFDCTGTADGEEIHAECTGEGRVITCTILFEFEVNGTRTNESLSMETRDSRYYVGGGSQCLYFTTCKISRWQGTRVAPEPTESCQATPAASATWGQVKGLYR